LAALLIALNHLSVSQSSWTCNSTQVYFKTVAERLKEIQQNKLQLMNGRPQKV